VAGIAIELKAATRRYGDRVALDSVSLRLGEGAKLAVLGSNGAGKTTLLKLLCGLLRPHSGEVSVLGSNLPAEAWAIRGRVGLLGHDPMLYRSLTVRENLIHQARMLGADRERVDRLIGEVGLAMRADEPIRNLSRGMVQRALFARVIVQDSPLILLDEPYANLDPGGKATVELLLESGRTVVISGHDPHALLEGADEAVGLRAGKVLFAGAAGEFGDSEIEALYG